jgi:ATP-dependent helicase/nuclease subunit A
VNQSLVSAGRAEVQQGEASHPEVSAFVSAHAGTGKTKVLIDRLLRLMLAGARPERILCLTFTKAAAAEMAIRLQQKLGAFATYDDAALDEALKALAIVPGAEERERARRLFADVLDLPGGMRINTIHAFCQSLLRRFPLEAALSPHFRLIEDADSEAAFAEAVEKTLPAADAAAIATVAGLCDSGDLVELVKKLQGGEAKLAKALMLAPELLAPAMRRAAGARFASMDALMAAAVTWPGEARLREALRQAADGGSATVRDKAGRMLGWLTLPPALRRAQWADWTRELFTKEGGRVAGSKFCNEKLAAGCPDIAGICEEEQARVEDILEQERALRQAAASAALLRVAAPMLREYAAVKDRGGMVDFDDLIRRTLALLESDRAPWVKFKLDGGIDHVLLDEVQDTSPVQWRIAAALTDDFFAGEGAAGEAPRTIFAVGDRKQSIYSFQGAAPEEFARWRRIYEPRVRGAGLAFRAPPLTISFRSTEAVLRVVQAVFDNPLAAEGVVFPGDAMEHIANRRGQCGSVTLWPLAPRPPEQELAPWTIPDALMSSRSAVEELVRALAVWLRAALSPSGMRLQSANRNLRPGDVLILVRKRGKFDRALVQELKRLDIPVAGLDRMVLTEQPAVQDLLSLAEFLLLPGDDLSLAEVLTSPLGGLSDDSLLDLAAQRNGARLWDTLLRRADERADWRAAVDFLRALLARVDFISPYALFAEALGPLGGRARVFARMGPQAGEPMDEFLHAAQHYASLYPPSMQGFLHWVRQSGAEIKREGDAAAGLVRVMTVHGAKGLEAPLVILPDTTSLPGVKDQLLWAEDPETGMTLPLWKPHKDFCSGVWDGLAAAARDACLAEYNRLFYVALTRARDHLLICGWQPKNGAPEASWYALARDGLTRLGAASTGHVWGEALVHACPQTAAHEEVRTRDALEYESLPAWAGAPPAWRAADVPEEPPVPKPLLPSRPEGVALGAVPPSRSPLLATIGDDGAAARGIVVHALLQHLPGLPAEAWREAARAYTAQALGVEAEALADRVVAILSAPELAPLFGPGSRPEQAIAGLVEGHVVTGQIDRLVVLPDQVLIADYKTSRRPPDTVEAVPVRYLRQMAAYRAVLERIYPGRPVRCLLVYTEGPTVLTLPDAVLAGHAPGAAQAAVA